MESSRRFFVFLLVGGSVRQIAWSKDARVEGAARHGVAAARPWRTVVESKASMEVVERPPFPGVGG